MDVLGAFDGWREDIENQMKEEYSPAKIADACREATEEIRKEIIQSWYPYNWASTDAATQYRQSMSTSGGGTSWSASVLTDSWVSSGAFNPPSLNAWYFSKHPGVTGDPQSYVLDFLMDDGIVGLPAAGAVTGWVNPHFKQAGTGLEAHFDASGIWQTFEARVKSKI